MSKILIILCLSLAAIASSLNIKKGEIIAHTEVFGDSQINPSTKEINTFLTIQKEVESIRGKIYFDTITLISQKRDRDSNMYELLNFQKYKNISFDISSIVKNENGYYINGDLTLNGITKNITTNGEIINNKDAILLKGGFSFNLTDFNLEPPTMFFLTVRNQIDISYNIQLNK
ncbi:YceI-like domain-containing periplasmic protein [Arcobacter acticola]|uniref:YceI-like domain-containing periplasmic protein n=1 Tax=Arcobacter acticola TaxID=1849015 RepID=A0A6M8EXJ7_9BACT|nr:YceI family protein [Arcobacter acticola]QKE27904.1 YceI-like domain-containing periplasmic protein [Arcobacter acticola]